jgi:DNA-directed RNA polymerase subunit K/omega
MQASWKSSHFNKIVSKQFSLVITARVVCVAMQAEPFIPSEIYIWREAVDIALAEVAE